MQPTLTISHAPIRPPSTSWEAAKSAARGPAAHALGSTRTYGKDQQIFAEGDRFDFFYKVVSGAVRELKILRDGRRHIGAFNLPGDIFGIESGLRHRFSAEALGSTTLVAYARSRLHALDAADSGLSGQVLTAVMRTLERAQTHMVLLGRKNAMEKIASFLLDMSRYMVDGSTVQLPMSRVDIADHLGLTIETVSRLLTQLERQRVIEVPGPRRGIVLRNKAWLQRLAGLQTGALSVNDI